MASPFYPQARREGFIVQPMDGELILQDGEVTRLLNETAASVWQKCDGHHSIADIARELALDEMTITYALAQLSQKHLLQTIPSRTADARPMTRREFLKKGAIAAAAIPVIKTIHLPDPNVPVSGACPGQSCVVTPDCTPPDVCISGCCVGV